MKNDYIGMHGTPWPDPIKGPWMIRFHWGEVDGRAECVGIDVRSFRSKESAPVQPRPVDPSGNFGAVTHTLLRTLRADGLIQSNCEAFADVTEWASKQASTGAKARRQAMRALETFGEPRRRGRPPKYPPEHYARVAEVYDEAYARNRTPRRAVAHAFDVPETTAGHWIANARRLGFLGENPGRGRAGATIPQARKGKKS